MAARKTAAVPAGHDPCRTPARPPLGRLGAASAAITVAALAAYHNSFSVPFFFDDRAQITDNPTIRHLFHLGTVLVPPPSAGVGGRPLLNLSFAFNYALGGMNPWGYHAFNLVIHILAGLTLFGILRHVLGRTVLAPLCAALIWTVHPLQTEAITYVAERAESMMGLFYLLTLYFFILYVASARKVERTVPRTLTSPSELLTESVRGTVRSTFLAWGSVVCCLCGIMTKEVVATAPVVVLLYDRTFVSGTFRAAWKRHWRIYAGYLASWGLLAYLLANLRQRGVGFDMGGGTWWDYALMESRALVTYIGRSIWPHPLVFDYGMGVRNPGWGIVPDVLAIVALLAATAWALFSKVRGNSEAISPRRKLGFAGAWFFLVLAPSSSVIAVAGQPTAEHRMYLPLAAVVSVIVCLAARFIVPNSNMNTNLSRSGPLPVRPSASDSNSNSHSYSAAAAALAAAAAVFALLGLTIARNRAYASEASLWRDVVAKRPDNPRARNGLGIVLAGEGDMAGAIVSYREALRSDPNYPEAHENLAAALQAQGRVPEAVAQCEEFVRLRPLKPESHYDLGVALQLDGRGAEAVAEFFRALELRPDYPEAENNLGLSLVGLGRYAEAGTHFAEAVRLAPNNPDMRLNLGSADYSAGDIEGAVREMRQAVRLAPGFAAAHYSLGVALRRLGRESEAEAEFNQARRLGQK